MKKLILSLLAVAQFSGSVMAQDSDDSINKTKSKTKTDVSTPSPYRTKFAVDGTLSLVGIGTNAVGLYLIQENKDGPTAEELAAIDQNIGLAKLAIMPFTLPAFAVTLHPIKAGASTIYLLIFILFLVTHSLLN